MTSLQTGKTPGAPSPFTDDEFWAAVTVRDPLADGVFYFSVSTTGVYCRPSCVARRPKRANVRFHSTCEDAERAGFRPCKRCRPTDLRWTENLTWDRISSDIDDQGYAVATHLLNQADCGSLVDLYKSDDRYRKSVDMARHGYGVGEYKYFAYPLPEIVAGLRTSLYPPLARIANRWNEALGSEVRYPDSHAAFLERCHSAGQIKPTPLLLRYGPGDYNRLHQDLYGDHVFPLQATILLSRPGRDFTGGEFVLTEQRARMQSRAEIVPLEQGDCVFFPVRLRPVQGARRNYRVNMRHGVSRLRAGHRHTLGIIFHDAK